MTRDTSRGGSDRSKTLLGWHTSPYKFIITNSMINQLLAHGVFSFASGLTIAVVGFGCDSLRELVDRLSAEPGAYPASSAINMGLSVALVTAVQAIWQRRQVNGALLLSILPLTFIGVLLSLNVFSASVLSALVPALGACLFGLCLAKLWMELADCRKNSSNRDSDDDRRHGISSWRWTGILGTASLAGGLLSGRCPPPGPAFMVVLLGLGGTAKVGGGEWRATAAFVTCCSSFLRVGLLLLENGASVRSPSEVSVLVVGGLAGVVAGNTSLLLCSPRGANSDFDQYCSRSPAPAAFRRLVLMVSLVSSIAMATGGPPPELSLVARPVALAALVLACAVAVVGAIWGCTVGAGRGRDARGAYATVSSDERDVEVQMKPLAGGNGLGSRREGDYDDDDDKYLDEEDGYLADEGETDQTVRGGGGGSRSSNSKRTREMRGSGAGRAAFSMPSKGQSTADAERETEDDFVGGGRAQRGPEKDGKKKLGGAAAGSPSRFPAGHTSEL